MQSAECRMQNGEGVRAPGEWRCGGATLLHSVLCNLHSAFVFPPPDWSDLPSA